MGRRRGGGWPRQAAPCRERARTTPPHPFGRPPHTSIGRCVFLPASSPPSCSPAPRDLHGVAVGQAVQGGPELLPLLHERGGPPRVSTRTSACIRNLATVDLHDAMDDEKHAGTDEMRDLSGRKAVEVAMQHAVAVPPQFCPEAIPNPLTHLPAGPAAAARGCPSRDDVHMDDDEEARWSGCDPSQSLDGRKVVEVAMQ